MFQVLETSNMAATFVVLLNFKVTIYYILESIQPFLAKYGTHVVLIKALKVNISGFGKIQYGHHFCHFCEFLDYSLSYLGKYSTNFNEICYTYTTYR